MNTKKCGSCNEIKTIDQFYKSKAKYLRYGVDYYCKYCRNGNSIKSHTTGNKKQCTISGCEIRHYAKGMCRNHYTRMKLNGTIEYKRPKRSDDNTLRDYNLRVRYLITIDEFNKMAKNGCEICGNKPKERALHMDHDHNCCTTEFTCGKCVRGIVCSRCNTVIGKYEQGLIRPDNPLLHKVANYVMYYKNKRYEVSNA
jgi:hypothetical protein